MISIKTAANQLNITIDEIQMMLMDVRTDWADCKEITEAEYQIIERSVKAKSGDNYQIAAVSPNEISLEAQQQLIENVSQVLGFPFVLAVAEEIRALDALHEVKNALALNVISKRRQELDDAIRQDSLNRQQAYAIAIEDLASQMHKPISVVDEMAKDIEVSNARLEAILNKVRSGKY